MLFDNDDRIVFVGDSVTDMGSKRPIGERVVDSFGHGYVREVENLLAIAYPPKKNNIPNKLR